MKPIVVRGGGDIATGTRTSVCYPQAGGIL